MTYRPSDVQRSNFLAAVKRAFAPRRLPEDSEMPTLIMARKGALMVHIHEFINDMFKFIQITSIISAQFGMRSFARSTSSL